MDSAMLLLVLSLNPAQIPARSACHMPSTQALGSQDWTERALAYEELKNCLPEERARKAVAQLLILENGEILSADETIASPSFKPGPAERGDYYEDLIQTVASFHDERSAAALATGAGRGRIVTAELEKWPLAVIPILVEQMVSSRSSELRIGSVQDLQSILAARGVLPRLPKQTRLSIRENLETVARDKNWILRVDAVEALGVLGDPSSAAMLREIARADPEPKVRKSARKAADRMASGGIK